jgi:hypothetical protein
MKIVLVLIFAALLVDALVAQQVADWLNGQVLDVNRLLVLSGQR